MDDETLKRLVSEARAASDHDARTLLAALEILDAIAAQSRSGKTRQGGKTITGARDAASGIRTVLHNRFGKVV